jgi:hypothetical protein
MRRRPRRLWRRRVLLLRQQQPPRLSLRARLRLLQTPLALLPPSRRLPLR